MSRARALGVLIGVAGASAHACDTGLGGPDVARVESARYVLAFRAEPGPIAVGRHFGLLLAICAKSGAPPPERIGVDAHMPTHRHGMNYAPTVEPAGPNRWRVEGLLFHMPGDWEFRFAVRARGSTDRLSYGYRLD